VTASDRGPDRLDDDDLAALFAVHRHVVPLSAEASLGRFGGTRRRTAGQDVELYPPL